MTATLPPGPYSPERATAIHEAGHAVLAYLLRRRFTSISVVGDDDSLGRVSHTPPGDWFRPDIEVDGRVRRLIEDHVMISLAGAETEAAWLARQPGAPADWEQHVSDGAAHDRMAAIGLADYVCGGSVPELEAYLEWLRQRVLGSTGRGDSWEAQPGEFDFVTERYRDGDDRYWTLVTALADAAQDAGELTWRRALVVMRAADPYLARFRRGPAG